MPDLTTTLKDAAYITVGFGVLGFQKAQVRRVELMKQLEEQRRAFEAQLAEASRTYGSQFEGTGRLIESQVNEAARAFKGLAQEVQSQVREVEAHVRSRLGLATA